MKETKLSDGMCDCVADGVVNDYFILAYNHNNNDDYIETKTIIVERDQT